MKCLQYYNNALIIYNDARMEDAMEYLSREMKGWKEQVRMTQDEKLLYKAYESKESLVLTTFTTIIFGLYYFC